MKCSLNRCELIVWVLLLGKAADRGASVAARWCNTCLIKLLSEPCTLLGMLTIQLDLSIWKKPHSFFISFTCWKLTPQSWVLKPEIMSVTSCYSCPSQSGRGCSRGSAVSAVSLCGCAGDVSRAECSELLLPSPALLWRPPRCFLQWTTSLRHKQRKKAIRTEVGTSLCRSVQLQFSLPKLSVGDHIQGGGGGFYLANRYFWLMLLKNMKLNAIPYFFKDSHVNYY